MDERTADVLTKAIGKMVNEKLLELRLHLEAKIIQHRNEIVAARESLIHVRHDMADLQAQIANLDVRRPEVRLPGTR